MLLQYLSGNAHACTTQYRRKSQIGLGQMGNMVNNPEGNGESTSNPGIVRILGIQIALDNLGPLAKMMVHLHEEARMHQIVRIEDADSIVFLVHGKELFKHPLQGIALAFLGWMGTLTDDGSCISSYLGGIVGAVICNNIDIIKLLRVFQLLEVLYQLADNRLLIVGSHNDSHLLLWGGNFLFLETPQSEEAYKEKIHCK